MVAAGENIGAAAEGIAGNGQKSAAVMKETAPCHHRSHGDTNMLENIIFNTVHIVCNGYNFGSKAVFIAIGPENIVDIERNENKLSCTFL